MPVESPRTIALLGAGWVAWLAYLLFPIGTPPDGVALALLAMPLLVATGRLLPLWAAAVAILAATGAVTAYPSIAGVTARFDLPERVVILFVAFAISGLAGALFRENAAASAALLRTRHHADDHLRHAVELRSILDAVPGGIVVLEGDHVRHYNEVATSLLHCAPGRLPEKIAPVLAAVESGAPPRIVTVDTADGPVELECSRTRLADGQHVLVFTDLTDVRRQNEELRRQQKALAEQRGRWEGLLERIDHCYFRVEDDRLEFSRSAPKVLVTTREDLEKDPWAWTQKIQGHDRPRVLEAIEEARQGKPQRLEFLCGEAGAAHWVRMALRPVMDHDRLVAVEGHGQDITPEVAYRIQTEALRRKEDRLRTLEEMDHFKTRFMHTVAHELSTPLTPLKMQVDLLAETAEENADDEQRDGFRLVQRNLLRLEALVKDMLDASRIQTGKLHVERHPIDLSTVVRDVCTSFHAQAQAAGISLTAEAPGQLAVDGDDSRLAQVLYNLLSNAVKFTPEGGEVRVELVRTADTVELRVTDSGLGLTRLQQTKLFVPFNQFHRDKVGAHVGTGMGLYICKGIVEAHGGTIEVHSEGPDKGTTFAIRLPAVEGDVEVPAPRPGERGRRPTRKLRPLPKAWGPDVTPDAT